MRYAYGLLLALACACGGGGTTVTNGGTNGGTTSVAQQLLEGCGVSAVDDFLEVLEIVEGLIDPNETDPAPVTVVDVDPDAATVGWTLDLDGDMNPDLTGLIQFTDGTGAPETAADVDQLAGGLDDLDALIASLPDGTQVVATVGRPEPPPIDLTLTFTILGGSVNSVSGLSNLPGLECLVTLDFLDGSLQDVGGEYPNLTVNIIANAEGGNIEGTITFDGTNQATAEVTLDGAEEVHAFLVNLDTGAVTPKP